MMNLDLTQFETVKLEKYRCDLKEMLNRIAASPYLNGETFQRALAMDDQVLIELNRRLTTAPSIR